MADLDLKRVCEFLTTVAQEAGQIILSARPAALTIVDKKNCEFTVHTGRVRSC